MKKVAIIVAGGKGVRMNADIPKQFLILKEKPILIHTIEKFCDFDDVILVLPKNTINIWEDICVKYNMNINHSIVIGGNTRFHSVKNGLELVDNNSIVAIHDGVRPFISDNLTQKLLSIVKKGIGAVPGIPVKESIRKIGDGETSTQVDRSNLYKVQTPQCFLSSEIKDSYSKNYSERFTDDASVFESNSGKITMILGEEKNVKITTKEDLRMTAALM